MSQRPTFPKRAVITAGMPYGNKNLHFGHVGGVFVPADAFARFLRDRLGAANVLFVSGTDCYGSPIMEGYRKGVESGQLTGTIEDYVARNHELQEQALHAYQIYPDLFAGSGLAPAKDVHEQVSDWFIRTLYQHGWIEKRSTAQFYDVEAGQFLNGRQVQGYCPVQGCKSEKAYADECDLGHQFEPSDLIKPTSSLTGTTPELRPVDNWYFKLPEFLDYLKSWADEQERRPEIRSVVTQTVREFLGAPVIYLKNELEEQYRTIAEKMPTHIFRPAEKGKQSFGLEFSSIDERDAAREVLAAAGMRYRTGKALVPFRITGNIDWGVPAPQLDGEDPLTVWCWPESLWAPISFCRTALKLDESAGAGRYASDDWRDWWCSDDAEVFQFIGQDNLYFYGVAQTALWGAMQDGPAVLHPHGGDLRQTTLVANHHILFMGQKASSSGKQKPPMATELLDYYTSDQLRAHWLALGLDKKSVSFNPKIFDPKLKDQKKAADPALKEGTLLTNVFNRLARSCFYKAQELCAGKLPAGSPSEEVKERADQAALAYEQHMHDFEFPLVMQVLDDFIRSANKRWTTRMREASALEGDARAAAELSCLVDAFYELRCASVLVHPIAPVGCEKIREYLQLPESMWSWEHLFEPLDAYLATLGEKPGTHQLKELPPRTDFFERPACQFN